MSIQYFYNFCLKEIDKTDLSGDLLTGVRKSFLQNQDKIKDKITSNSDADSFSYEFSIEKEKPMKWLVKNASGTTVQEVMQSDNGKYYIYFYEAQALYKRLLFSKHHTLLKEEYFDTATGVVRHTLEPRKAQNGLCILYTVKSNPQSIPLFEEPEVFDDGIRRRLLNEYDDYTVVASTNEGIIRFLSDQQLENFNSTKEKFEAEAAAIKEETFVGDDTPLLDKINAKDFNVKRNLSSALDITRAMEFGVSDTEDEAPAEREATEEIPAAESAESVPANTDSTENSSEIESAAIPTETPQLAAQEDKSAEPAPAEETSSESSAARPSAISNADTEEDTASAAKPDKEIMADGAVYSYYGELDAQGNRSGYGRTMTDLGRTAYEGFYYNDKRSGNGSYYYKDGSLCYTGDWMENARHGVGVGVSSRDGSIHVGTWRNNKPHGNGVRLTSGGDIKFVCKELSDGKTVLMNYMPDDTVIISKYDEKGMKIGESTISLKDLPI